MAETKTTLKPCPSCGATKHRFIDGTFNRCLRCQYTWNELDIIAKMREADAIISGNKIRKER